MFAPRNLSSLIILLILISCQGPAPRTVLPVPSLEDRAAAAGWHDGRPWMDQHLDGLKIATDGKCDLLLLGDSITQSWGGPGRRVGAPASEVFQHWFGQIRVGNLGISGDRTQHLLWRIENGALDGANPKVIVILIGTNNIGHDPPTDIALGIEAVVKATRKKASEALILLHPILARGKTPDDRGRRDVAAVNEQLRHLEKFEQVEIIDLDPMFLRKDGSIYGDLYRSDALHLSATGYEAWARALAPRLRATGLAIPPER